MNPPLTLDAALGQPVLTVAIDGKDYQFSEIPLEGLASLQAWARQNVPHPLASLREHLDGLPEAVQLHLADAARDEARYWPPDPTTASGVAALLGSEKGQLAVFDAAIRVHQPAITATDVRRLFRVLATEAGKEGSDAANTLNRIVAVAFGLPQDEGEPGPKGE